MTRKSSRSLHRPGFSFLELQVSLLLLGIVLGAMVPLVIMHARQTNVLEKRWWDPDLNEETMDYESSNDHWIDPYRDSEDGPVYYLVPPNIMAGELGAPASLKARKKDGNAPSLPSTLQTSNLSNLSPIMFDEEGKPYVTIIVDWPDTPEGLPEQP